MWFDRALDDIDLTAPFVLLSVLGAALCLYVNQKTWHDAMSALDPPGLRWLRRGAMTLIALTICWSVLYLLQLDLRPRPPQVGLIAALDFLFSVKAVTLFWRSKPEQELERRGVRRLTLPSKTRIR